VPRLLAAYRRGIFPWYDEGQPILWWSPAPRAVLFPADHHLARRLRRRLRQNPFCLSADLDFDGVIAACGATRADTGTWITSAMSAAYRQLHQQGFAHSVECWENDTLVGGVYGVLLGRVFFGESMFSTATDASKAALVLLMDVCRSLGVELVDCQIASAHLRSLGAVSISRPQFTALLQRWVDTPRLPGQWRRQRRWSSELVAGGSLAPPG
jgi:leucyl/phenylalanyl-tRNA---protein transferase